MVSRTTGFCTLALVLSASLAFASTKANGPATLRANDGAPNVAAQRQMGAPSLTSALNCPSNTLLNQPSVDPAGDWSFSTTELAPGYKMYDDFTCVVGSIESVSIVGLSLVFSGSWTDCTTENPPTFLVEFWGAGAQPGALLASYTVTPTVTSTGELFLGFPSNQYDMTLSPPLTGVYSGWISVQGQTAASGDCWLLWGNSLTTNGATALQWDGSAFSDTTFDAALCLGGTAATLLGACCDEPSGLCVDDVNAIDCCGAGMRFLAGGSCDDFDPPCGQQPGACCYDDATCVLVPQQFCRNKTPGDIDCDGDIDFFDIDPFVLALNGPTAYFAQFPACNWMNADCDLDGDVDFFDIDPFVALLGTPPVTYPAVFLGVGTTCAQCPCAILCPPGSTPEAEACGSDTNGGCNSDPAAFEPIVCGQTICGTIYSTTALRDTDWYIITLTQPTILNISLLAEMDAVTGLIEPLCYGGAFDCANITGSINPFLSLFGCAGGSVTTDCLPAGEYVIFVAPAVFGDFGCEKDYNLRVTCEPCTLPPGACCFFPSGACTDGLTVYECLCVGGEWQGADTLCSQVTCPTPPANDVCAGAELLDLTSPQIFTVNNQYATDDGTPSCGTSAPYRGLWYKVVGNDQKIFMTTCSPGTTNPDTKIQIFCGCDYQCVTGKDDDGTGVCAQNGFLTTIEWCGKDGVEYYILVGSFGSADFGDIQIGIGYTGEVCTASAAESCAPPPPGDTCADPIVIPSLPYNTTNDSCLYTHQYNAVCPYSTAGSKDVVYQYTTGSVDELVTISLCNDATAYDTKVYVFAGDCNGTAIYCNDDECSTLSYPDAFVSLLECVTLTANTTYYIVVDGYGSAECGVYNLTIDACVPCVVECPPGGVAELEACGADTNGGCNMTTPAFEPMVCGETKCGTAWYDGTLRDTDWYQLTLASPARITVEGSGEFDILVGVIAAPCPATAFIASATADKCAIASVTTTDCLPAGTYYIFAAPQFNGLVGCPADYYIRATCTACAVSYCSASVTTSGCDETIVGVTVPGVLTNTGTGCGNGGPNGYSDYTAISGNMSMAVGSYPITVNVAPSYSTDRVSLWVDWDHNQIFDAAETLVLTYVDDVPSNTGTATGTIVVPGTALQGATRMRVRLNYNAAPPPCGSTTYGEVEDYTINVVP